MSAVKATKRRPAENDTKRTVKSALRGTLIGTAVLFILLIALSAVCLKADPEGGTVYLICVLVSCAVSAFSSGFISVRPIRKNGALLGMFSVLLPALACVAAVLICAGSVGKNMLFAFAVMLIFGAFGGISAANMRKNQRKR